MKKLLLIPCLLLGLAGSAHALPDPLPNDDGPTPTWVGVDAGTSATAVAEVPEEITLTTALEDLAKVSQAIKDLRADSGVVGTKTALWMALLLAITVLLLHLLKLALKIVPKRWEKWKPWMSRIAGLLGVLVYFFEAYTGSMATAVVYGLIPPLAVWANEIYSTSKS